MSLDVYAPFDRLRIDRPQDGILRIVIDNPGKLNALDRALHAQLADVWRVVDRDPWTRAVLVHGEGGVFSTGGDLEMVKEMMGDPHVRNTVMREARDLVHNMIACSPPIVSAIQGHAIGAGMAVALMADVSVAGPGTKFMDGHTRFGVAAGDHAAIIWPLLVGMAKAKYHLLTCETIRGEEAERMGLVSLCVPDDEVVAKATEVAERLAAGSPSAIRWTKQALNGWLRQAAPIFDASVALEMLGFVGGDAAEGVAAIEEKRAARFETRFEA